tara:strand:- start:1271 stop:1903 length:633 start_codon:yes stop_codon:yes gene_type:complete
MSEDIHDENDDNIEEKKKVPDNHYIDNNEFFDAMVEWKKLVNAAESVGDPKPPITNYIGECFLKIATRLAFRANFINYPYQDEMIGDGVENCIMYASNFDPEKSKNPFSYFTQIIYYAFLRRIQKEKKQMYIKYKTLEQMDVHGVVPGYLKWKDDDKDIKDPYAEAFGLSENDIEKFKPKTTKKRGRKKKNTAKLDDVLSGDDNEDSPDK